MPKVGMEPIRKAQVIQATIDCISEVGLESLTIDAVAQRAGVSKGVVNYYFAGKRDLLLQSYEAFLESYNQRIMDAIRPDMSALELMEVAIDICLPDAETVLPLWPQEMTEIIVSENSSIPTYSMEALVKVYVQFLTKTVLDEGFRDVFIKVYATYMEGTVQMFQKGISAGEFGDLDPEEAAYGLLAMLDGLIMYINIGFKPISPQRAKNMCKEYIRGYMQHR